MSVRDLIILGSSSQQPTRRRNHGAYLFRWNEEGFLIDPGEGTQRQFIHAEVSPTTVTRILISHFHGDHCYGLGSMLLRLNLDKVTHPIHCYYPASGKRYFDRLRYSTLYHETIEVIEHPVSKPGIVEERAGFTIEAAFLEHGVDNIGWRISEDSRRKFYPDKLAALSIRGPLVGRLEKEGKIEVHGRSVTLDEVSYIRKGDSVAIVIDTRPCPQAIEIAKGAKILLCESTYAESEKELARAHNHLTAKEAAEIARTAGVEKLVLTHFSARYPSTKELVEEAKTLFPHVVAAEDFMTIPFPVNP